MLRLQPLLKAEITLAPAQEVGETPHGRRRIVPITGGSFRGERLSGRVLPGGADWLNGVVCVASGARRAAAVELEVFEVK